ncbi:hypothetical protein HaLaN_26642 [Haematococcus lacustris]|uniref:Uncharacterized protein n=1 Tax=Haematococcus lacustris TaxID=44745 RepID=A0A6A0A6R1_HAELA|nr:hypothetical protein HaLaN_26642 [Haematococcus lacustris]
MSNMLTDMPLRRSVSSIPVESQACPVDLQRISDPHALTSRTPGRRRTSFILSPRISNDGGSTECHHKARRRWLFRSGLHISHPSLAAPSLFFWGGADTLMKTHSGISPTHADTQALLSKTSHTQELQAIELWCAVLRTLDVGSHSDPGNRYAGQNQDFLVSVVWFLPTCYRCDPIMPQLQTGKHRLCPPEH